MKRLWIRAHALHDVGILARRHNSNDCVTEFAARDVCERSRANDMVILEIPDALAPIVMADGYLILCGKVLEEGEEVPYVGSDPGLTVGEMRAEGVG